MTPPIFAEGGQEPIGTTDLHGRPLFDCFLAEAFALIDSQLAPLSAESIPVLSAVGRRLAEPAIAEASVPGFRRAAMDGFAIRFEDVRRAADGLEISLSIVGESLPGKPCVGTIRPDECVAIATGAVVPDGCDTVVRWEWVERNGETVVIRNPVEARKDVALPDEDIPAGSVIVAPPRTLRPQDVAACCSAGVRELQVIRTPRVGLLATGDELLPPTAMPGGGRIIDTNSIVLRHLVERDCGRVVVPTDARQVILPDNFEVIRSAVVSLVEKVDCLLISGGTSHGQGDHTLAVLAELGTVAFRGVRIRPAAPTAFGTIRGVPVFLLPGNPVACLLGYDLLARRAVRRQGSRSLDWPYSRKMLRTSRPIRSAFGRFDCVRVRCLSDETVEQVWPRGASILSSTVTADGFVVVPENLDGYEAGEPVEVHFFDAPHHGNG